MFGSVARWFGAASSGSAGAAPETRVRLGVEGLESRECPATLAARARAVAAETLADARTLVYHVAVAEYYYPTIARDGVVADLIAVHNAADARHPEAVFAWTAQLVHLLQVEAQTTAAYGLYQTSPLAFQAIQDDLKELAADRLAEQRVVLAAQKSAPAAVRAQVQQQFRLPAISPAAAGVQASQRKIAQLDALQNQQASYFSGEWAASFAPVSGNQTYRQFDDPYDSGEFSTAEYEGPHFWRSGETIYLDFDGSYDGGDPNND
jgi:hypothetical protein